MIVYGTTSLLGFVKQNAKVDEMMMLGVYQKELETTFSWVFQRGAYKGNKHWSIWNRNRRIISAISGRFWAVSVFIFKDTDKTLDSLTPEPTPQFIKLSKQQVQNAHKEKKLELVRTIEEPVPKVIPREKPELNDEETKDRKFRRAKKCIRDILFQNEDTIITDPTY